MLSVLQGISVALVLFVPSIFLHELGHALVGRWAGLHVTSFGVGTHRPMLQWDWLGMRVYICRNMLSGGLTHYIPRRLFEHSWLNVATLSGGFLCNALLAGAAFGIYSWFPGSQWWSLPLCLSNLFLFFFSVLPLQLSVGGTKFPSDGSQILALLRGRNVEVSAAQAIESVSFMQRLLGEVGDRDGEMLQHVQLSYLWVALGDFDNAEAMFRALEPSSFASFPAVRGFYLLVGYAVAQHTQQFEEAEHYLDALDVFFEQTKDLEGQQFVLMLRIELHITCGQLTEATAMMEALQSPEQSLPAALRRVESIIQCQFAMAQEASNAGPPCVWSKRLAANQGDGYLFMLHFELAEHEHKHGREVQSQDGYAAFLKLWEGLVGQLRTPALRRRFVDVHRERVVAAISRLSDKVHAPICKRVQQIIDSSDELSHPTSGSGAKGVWGFVWLTIRWCAIVLVLAVTLACGQSLYQNGKESGVYQLALILFGATPTHRWLLRHNKSEQLCQKSLKLWRVDPKAARALLLQAHEQNAYNAIACYKKRIWEEVKRKRPREALAMANQLLDWKLPDAQKGIPLFRGKVKAKLGDLAGASEDFARALRSPDPLVQARSLIEWARVLDARKESTKALEKCQQASAIVSASWLVGDGCLPLYVKHRRKAKIKAFCRKALAQPRLSVSLFRSCSDAYTRSGDLPEAIDVMEQEMQFWARRKLPVSRKHQKYMRDYTAKQMAALQAKIKALRKRLAPRPK